MIDMILKWLYQNSAAIIISSLIFIDHFPKDTELYRVMTTKPQEVASA